MTRTLTVSVTFPDVDPAAEQIVDAEVENIRTVLEAQLGSWQRMYLHFTPDCPPFEIGVK